MEYQEYRMYKVNLFEDTIRYCERNPALLQSVLETRECTVLYSAPIEDGQRAELCFEKPAVVTVSSRSILTAAQAYKQDNPDCHIGILNFISPVNPGGNVLRGGGGQEEFLCRCTTLYPCLNTAPLWDGYYGLHCISETPSDTDACIYIPDVQVIRTDDENPERMKREDWFMVDMIGVAPPTGDIKQLAHKFQGALQIASYHGLDVLVVGLV